MEKKKLVILDGNSLINRAFYALPPMISSSGQPTGAIYGLTTMLLKIFNDIRPDYIAAAFDMKAPTFRHIEYADYKAGRKKMPDELAHQLQPAKELLKAFGVGIFQIEGYEADDIIGTISKKYESGDTEVTIYTGDRDALQLVSEYTKVIITKKGISEIDMYTKDVIKEKYGFSPEGIIDLKGLMGDASDNIPGVPGIGEKTAIKLLGEFGTLEGVYENIDSITAKKVRENLEQYKDDAILSKKLATIDRNVPLKISLDDMKAAAYDYEMVSRLFMEYEFRSLMDKIVKNEDVSFTEVPEIKMYDGSRDIIEKIAMEGRFNFLILLKGKDPEGMLIENSILVAPEYIEHFNALIADPHIIKNTFGAKQVYNYYRRNNLSAVNIEFDAEIAAYILNPSESKYDISSILHRYANITAPQSNTGNDINISAMFVNNMEKIKVKMLEEIDKFGMRELFHNIEMPLIDVLSFMECEGFRVDGDTLVDIGKSLDIELERLTNDIYSLAGEKFNINSTKQLGVILFEKLSLPVIKKTKTGYSTDAEVLEELLDRHDIVDKILTYRQLVKLKSTYVDGLISNISSDSKIHSSFNQTVTATGRISSTEPNMQNIPIRLEQGREIRKAFIPSSRDYLILSADYSQIELRVLAHISGDSGFIEAFNKNQDIHRRTASEVFNIPMEDVTPLYRSRAKAINFGIVYGLSDYGLSRDLKIGRKEAKRYIDNYFSRYNGVKKYLDNAISDGRTMGYVKTMLNRIRYIPEINSSNRNVKLFGERLAMNTPIQGTAADIIKIAMVNVFMRLKKEKLLSKLILQVHDELVLEVHTSEFDYIKALVKEEMERALKLSVPLIVDIKWGNNWYEAK